jgi:hypothetical protein
MNTIKSTSELLCDFGQPKFERRFISRMVGVVLVALLVFTISCSSSETKKLKEQVEQLSNQVGILEDVNAIRKLHFAYGYYIDKCLYEDTVSLFADDGEVHFSGGIYRGKEGGVRRLYVGGFQKGFTGGKPGPVHGFLLDHLQMQDIVDVAPDRQTAKGRFRAFMQAGAHETSRSPMGEMARKNKQPIQWWEGGIYENSYVKVDGIWKIKVLNYNPLWHAEYKSGWAFTKPNYVPLKAKLYPENPNGPDALMEPAPVLWPDTMIVPFHYMNPVTGKPPIQ